MTTKLNQPTALRLELLRGNGFSDSDILSHLQAGDLTPFAHIEGTDFTSLLDTARSDWASFERAVHEGYELSFISIFGVQNLIQARFHLAAGRDYQAAETTLEDLPLSPEAAAWLSRTVGSYWVVAETAPGRFRLRHVSQP